MKNFIKTSSIVVVVITLFVIIGGLISYLEKYPFIADNMISSVFVFMFWAVTGGFHYDTKPPGGKFSTEHSLKPVWCVVLIITTFLFIPAGLVVKLIFFSGLREKNEISLSKKFYFFFQKEIYS